MDVRRALAAAIDPILHDHTVGLPQGRELQRRLIAMEIECRPMTNFVQPFLVDRSRGSAGQKKCYSDRQHRTFHRTQVPPDDLERQARLLSPDRARALNGVPGAATSAWLIISTGTVLRHVLISPTFFATSRALVALRMRRKPS
jgi:hypothetical protein